MFVPRGDRDLGVAYQTHPGNQASSRGEAKNSAVLLSRDGYLLEPTVCPKGSQASCGVWREDSGLDSRPCRKRRPSSRDDGGVSWVFSSCGASVGCLMKYHGDLREPLVWRQENPVFHLSCELELGIALQSLQGKIDIIYACVQDLVFHYWADRDLRVAFSTHLESQASS